MAAIVGRFDLAAERVVVCGDFNDVAESEALAPFMRLDGLRDVLEGDEDRWTYGGKVQLDYLMVSEALGRRVVGHGVERRGVWRATGAWERFPEVTGAGTAGSDHAAVWADFEV